MVRLNSDAPASPAQLFMNWPAVVLAVCLVVSLAALFQTPSYLWLALAPVAMSVAILSNSPDSHSMAPGSPWKHLSIEDGKLTINGEIWPLHQVDTVFLHRQKDRGVLQMPYNNNHGKMPELQFSEMYFPAVEAFIRLRVPTATLCILPALNNG